MCLTREFSPDFFAHSTQTFSSHFLMLTLKFGWLQEKKWHAINIFYFHHRAACLATAQMAISLPSSLGACCHIFHAWWVNLDYYIFTGERVFIRLTWESSLPSQKFLISHFSPRSRLSLSSPAVIALMAVWCGRRSPSSSHLHSNLSHNFSIKLCSAASCRRRGKQGKWNEDGRTGERGKLRSSNILWGQGTQKSLYGHFLLGQSLPGIFWLGERKSLIIDEMTERARGKKRWKFKMFPHHRRLILSGLRAVEIDKSCWRNFLENQFHKWELC